MAKKELSLENALESGAKWRSTQKAKSVMVLTFLFFIGAVLGQLGLAGKRKRYLLSFGLTAVGLVMALVMLISSAGLNSEKMFAPANITYDPTQTQILAGEKPLSLDGDIRFYEKNVTLNCFRTQGGSYYGAVAVFVDDDGVWRYFDNTGELSKEVAEKNYENFTRYNSGSFSSTTTYSDGKFYTTWDISVGGGDEKHTLRYEVDPALLCCNASLTLEEELFQKGGVLGESSKQEQVFSIYLYWNAENSRFEDSGNKYPYSVRSEKYNQTRTMIFAFLIAAGAGLVLMYVFLICQMQETNLYFKYMKQCEQKLPREERRDFRKKTDQLLRAGDMEGTRALLEEHRLI